MFQSTLNIDQNLQKLFESTNKSERFLFNETALSPLRPVSKDLVKQHIINPLTGKEYDGVILFGEFASIGILNNNNRYYSKENYIEYVELLKREVFSPKGVYGEYEHPKGYPVDGKNISHKILDLWYDETDDKVYGYVMLLNTPNGLIAQEVIKSGGQLGISARGGGAEIQKNDGTFDAKLKLLITYDLVYHPGFVTSVVSHALFENDQGKFGEKKQEKTQQQRDEATMQENESSQKKQIEDDLQKAVDDKDKETKKLNENNNALNSISKYLKRL